ncbi:MAG TPA: TraR/DksA C4-type zinc finger protein [Gemmatimonas sp.]|nr:TraR/DksA C4-type zinc finger protein [Gemmatimonas sp.]
MPLTKSQLKLLEKRLQDERTRLTDNLREFTEGESEEENRDLAGAISRAPLHPADLGTDVANEELEASVATRRSAELAEIDAALERLLQSPETFGLDENTGEEIPFERLDIIPWARTAVNR